MYSISIEVPILVKDGGEVVVLVDVKTKLTTPAFKKAFRMALHQRLPLSTEALENYQNWFDQGVESLFTESIESFLEDFGDD